MSPMISLNRIATEWLATEDTSELDVLLEDVLRDAFTIDPKDAAVWIEPGNAAVLVGFESGREFVVPMHTPAFERT